MSTTQLAIPSTHDFSSIGDAVLGLFAWGGTVTATSIGGFYAAPQPFPIDYDRSRDGHLYALIGNAGVTGPATGTVVLKIDTTIIPTPNVTIDDGANVYVTIPASWPHFASLVVELLINDSPAFPAHSIAPNSWFGARLARIGSDPDDTWAATLFISRTLRLTYNRLCQFCDCL